MLGGFIAKYQRLDGSGQASRLLSELGMQQSTPVGEEGEEWGAGGWRRYRDYDERRLEGETDGRGPGLSQPRVDSLLGEREDGFGEKLETG